MTRDEAIEIIHGVTYPASSCADVDDSSFARDRKWSAKIVDGLVALGILKLDQPLRETFRLCDELKWDLSEERLCSALKAAKLKIVDE